MEYSIIIRTLGTAGEKYARLLNSIQKQTLQPKEILVVLPEGYAFPPERLGTERFVYSKRGMISQRIIGTLEATSDFVLFLDDDLEFDSNMIELLFQPIKSGIADLTFPIMTEMLPQGARVKFLTAIIGSAVPVRSENFYTKVLKTSGWKYNSQVDQENIRYYTAQCAPGACYLTKREAALNIHLEDELWLEKTSYPIPEDLVNIYKYDRLGYKVVGVSSIPIVHLDAGSKDPDRRLKIAYAMCKNKIIFWHRFIYLHDKTIFLKLFSFSCLLYYLLLTLLLQCCNSIFHREFKSLLMTVKGIFDGIKFLFSKEYRKIPSILFVK